jgi:pimeloyl-ACP methyl ester carboxylesterase
MSGASEPRTLSNHIKGLTPAYSFDVNINWMKFDPWMTIRMIFRHFGHPMSPLSSTILVKQAFFCDQFPMDKVATFERYMPKMESFAWPMGQNFRFGTFRNILQRITGWGVGQRVLVLAGENDRLVDLTVAQREAREAREAFVHLAKTGRIEAKKEQSDSGVRYYVVKGAGHHMQNDLQWEDGARQLLQWYEQL